MMGGIVKLVDTVNGIEYYAYTLDLKVSPIGNSIGGLLDKVRASTMKTRSYSRNKNLSLLLPKELV